MLSRKFRYRLNEYGSLHIQIKHWFWPFWIDETGWSWAWMVKGWVINPSKKWKYLDQKDITK